MFSKTFTLSGLTCPACKKISEKRLSTIPGIMRVEVNLDSGAAVIEAERKINSDEIRSALQNTSYQLIE